MQLQGEKLERERLTVPLFLEAFAAAVDRSALGDVGIHVDFVRVANSRTLEFLLKVFEEAEDCASEVAHRDFIVAKRTFHRASAFLEIVYKPFRVGSR